MTTGVEFDSAVIARCSDEERQRISQVAQDHGMGVSEFARYAVLEYIAAFMGGVPSEGDE